MVKKFGKEYFDEKYKQEKGFLWGIKPSKMALLLDDYLSRESKILDLGCGEGKDALFLAKKGHRVTAVDISETAIEKLNKRASEEKIKINTKVADMFKYNIKENYDAIISLAAIHFVDKKINLYKLIKTIKKRTNKKGFNVITVFRKGDSSEGKFKMYYFDNGELSKLYSDWEIIKYLEFLKEDRHGVNGKIHFHKNANLIAQKLK